MKKLYVFLTIVVIVLMFSGYSKEKLSIDVDYPGGNVLVDRIESTTVYLRQDLRDTKGW